MRTGPLTHVQPNAASKLYRDYCVPSWTGHTVMFKCVQALECYSFFQVWVQLKENVFKTTNFMQVIVPSQP